MRGWRKNNTGRINYPFFDFSDWNFDQFLIKIEIVTPLILKFYQFEHTQSIFLCLLHILKSVLSKNWLVRTFYCLWWIFRADITMSCSRKKTITPLTTPIKNNSLSKMNNQWLYKINKSWPYQTKQSFYFFSKFFERLTGGGCWYQYVYLHFLSFKIFFYWELDKKFMTFYILVYIRKNNRSINQ